MQASGYSRGNVDADPMVDRALSEMLASDPLAVFCFRVSGCLLADLGSSCRESVVLTRLAVAAGSPACCAITTAVLDIPDLATEIRAAGWREAMTAPGFFRRLGTEFGKILPSEVDIEGALPGAPSVPLRVTRQRTGWHGPVIVEFDATSWLSRLSNHQRLMLLSRPEVAHLRSRQ